MTQQKIAIPTNGKMSFDTLAEPHVMRSFQDRGLYPVFFAPPHLLSQQEQMSDRFFGLKTDEYEKALYSSKLLSLLPALRAFVPKTDTTDLKFRESVGTSVSKSPVAKTLAFSALQDLLRRFTAAGRMAAWLESMAPVPNVHASDLKEQSIEGLVIPGMGSRGFHFECLFAREAARIGLPVVSAIINYDNLSSRGFRGFMPDRVAVWSKLMADEAIEIQRIPASKIEITGPVKFDEYFRPLPVERSEFISQMGLDPSRKTIFYAGGVNLKRCFMIYNLFIDPNKVGDDAPNVVFRPYPHPKVLDSPEWEVLENLLLQSERVYVSVPAYRSIKFLRELAGKVRSALGSDVDELPCLLKYCDVMINEFSTISLEAAICDLPTVHIAFDKNTFGLQDKMSMEYTCSLHHNQRRLRLLAAKVAEDEAQLVEAVYEYLDKPELDRDARHAYALSECEYLDGKASERLASLVASRIPM